MDFHAVAEAAIDGGWHVVDATAPAPRQSLVPIVTGRDAADIAFLSARGDLPVRVSHLEVQAVVDEPVSADILRAYARPMTLPSTLSLRPSTPAATSPTARRTRG